MKRRRIIAFVTIITVIVIYLLLAFILNAEPQNMFYNLTEAPVPAKGQRVLVFSPHPDDESIAVGGFIYTSSAAGAKTEVVLATDANRRGLRDKRYLEFKQATESLGVPASELRFWGYPDGKLSLHADELKIQVQQEIELFQPELVIYPHPEDAHPDHAALGKAVEEVLAQKAKSSVKIAAYSYLVHYKYYPEPKMLTRQHWLLPPVAIANDNEAWEKFSLTPEAENAKFIAIHKYRTQLRNPFLKPIILGLMRNNEIVATRHTGS